MDDGAGKKSLQSVWGVVKVVVMVWLNRKKVSTFLIAPFDASRALDVSPRPVDLPPHLAA